MAMDVKRDPAILKKKKMRRMAMVAVGSVAVVALSAWMYRLRPAAPRPPHRATPAAR